DAKCCSSSSSFQDLYNQSVDALEVMLRALLSEKPNPAELQNFLDHLAPWMTSKKAHERERAVRTSAMLSSPHVGHFMATDDRFSLSYPRPELLIGRLALHVDDPEKEIGRQAMEGLYFLYSLMWCQKGKRGLSELGGPKAPACEQLDTNPNLMMSPYRNRIHAQLRAIHHSHARQVVMMALCLLARAFMEEVSTALLKCPLLLDRDAAGMWRTLAKTEAICHSHRFLNVLLNELQERPSISEDRAFIIPLAAASALCEVLSVSMCTQAVTRFYPRLLMALLVQVHHTIGLSLPDSRVSRKESSLHEFTSVEKEGGWELLTSSEEHHRRVGLLARAMVHYSCCELWRILYLLVPFLERGDKQHKITAMAFFVEVKVTSSHLLWYPCLPDFFCLCVSQERVSVRSAAISLFGKMVKKVKRSQGLMKEEDVLDSLIPLLLHLQEGNADMAEKCKNALDECSRLLEWRLPKQVGNRKAWHNHQEDVDEICQYLVNPSELCISGYKWVLGQFCSFQSTFSLLFQPSWAYYMTLRRPYVFAAQAHEHVLAVYWKLKFGLVEQPKVNSDSAEKHKSPPNPPATEGTSSRLCNALNLWK
uniref:Uncharacterized protein n=1 Tax=Chelonoidis abingdonii TaxID=106734 RepID=A0A8C0IUH0_CHEAB